MKNASFIIGFEIEMHLKILSMPNLPDSQSCWSENNHSHFMDLKSNPSTL